MSETIHDAVRATLARIKAQHGETLLDGLEIRHTNTAPYNIGLWCHRCQEYVRQWTMSDDELKALPGLVSVQVDYHTCWLPSPAVTWGAATEATDTPAGTEGTDAREHLAGLLALWFDLPEDSSKVQGPIDAFARDLATKQRNALTALDIDHGGRHPYHADIEGIIGLIDPDGWQS